ncbi:hypothetical protein DFH27DRAFT_518306 [Peziza echinospora]|nr:hypothetical protein DFH27DRAFT_518306 [Peziza echinospora]
MQVREAPSAQTQKPAPQKSPAPRGSQSTNGSTPAKRSPLRNESSRTSAPKEGNHAETSPPPLVAAEPIAIVGIGCRLPGASNTPSQFWDMLANGRSGQTPVPPGRFNMAAFHHPAHLRPGSIEADAGYFLDPATTDVRQFDPAFFNITPLEATTLDPQQRKLLEVAYEAFESGGAPLDALRGSSTGVFVANFTSDFQTMQYRDPEHGLLQPYLLTGMGLAMLANRLSHAFDLAGPSMTVDTACSSGLYALHLACQSIADGGCEAALVAGTNLILTVDQHMASAKLGVLSPSSTCHTFDARADGYARGEGVSALYVKRLSAAVRDGDPIRAVVRATAVNSNGRGMGGITNPSVGGQERVIRAAYERAGLAGRLWQTGYFECHGTGTKVGDPLEVQAVGRVFSGARKHGEKLLVGSVKTNVGHGEAASGITSIIKCVLALERGAIPATIGLERPSPEIDFEGAGVEVVTRLCSWPARTGSVRRASINSFGYGGANAHAILDATPAFYRKQTVGEAVAREAETGDAAFDRAFGAKSAAPEAGKKKYLLAFSAHDLPTLKNNVRAIQGVVEDYDILDVAYTLGCRRSKLYHRAYSIVDTSAAAESTVREQLGEEELTLGRKPATGTTLGFVFTGQGAQWARMGAELLAEYPSFLATIRHLDSILARLPAGEAPAWTLEAALLETAKTSNINDVSLSQPVCTAVQLGLVGLLSGWGVAPVAVVGHSSGEIAAAYAAGKISMEAAIIIAYYRGYCCAHTTLPTQGAMLAVGLGPEDVQPYLEPYAAKGTVRVACVNSPKSVTLSGDRADIEAIKAALDADHVFARLLQTGGRAYHSHHMALVGPAYERKLDEHVRAGGYGTYRAGAGATTMVSSVTTQPVADTHIPNAYWRANLEAPVLFSQALTHMITAHNIEQLVELGPHSALSGPVRDIRESLGLTSAKLAYAPSLIRGQDSVTSVLALAGNLWIRDFPVDMARVNSAERHDPATTTGSSVVGLVRGKVLVDLPAYQWTYGETLHWCENRISHEFRNKTHLRHDLLGSRMPGSAEGEPVWRNIIKIKHLPWVEGHKVGDAVIFPAAGYIAMAVEAATQVLEVRPSSSPPLEIKGYCLRNVSVKTALRIPPSDPGVEMLFNMRPLAVNNSKTSQATFEFKVSSVLAGKWSDNCSGSVTILFEKREPYRKWTLSLSPSSLRPSPAHEKWYTAFSNIGLNYGPTFALLRNIKVNPALAVAHAQTSLAPTSGANSAYADHPESRYAVHPCTLDTFLQAGLIACHARGINTMNRCYLPVGFEEITIFPPHGDEGAPTLAEVAATAYTTGKRTLIGNVQARLGASLLMDMKDLRCISVDPRTQLAQHTPESLSARTPFLRLHWKPDVTALTRAQASRLFPGQRRRNLAQVWQDWQALSLLMLLQVTGEVSSRGMVVEEPAHLRHWYGWMGKRISQAKAGGFGGIWGRVQGHLVAPCSERDAEILRLKEKLDPEIPELGLIYNVYTRIPEILRGEVDGVQVVMVDNMALMTDSYTRGIRHAGACRQLGNVADLLGHKNPGMKVLEIGAGTGGATQIMLDALGGRERLFRRYGEYVFTDVSKGFLGSAGERFREYGGVRYGVLDVEVDPEEQGFEVGGYDLVVSSNCLHATSNINNTIANVRKLLKPDGYLLILEVTEDTFSGSLLYGALPSYWCSIQDGRIDHPFLSKAKWHTVFMNNGFSGLDIALDDYEGNSEPTAVMLTRAVALEAPIANEDVPPQPTTKPDIVLIYRTTPPPLLDALHTHALANATTVLTTTLENYPHLPHKPTTTIVLTDLEDAGATPLLTTITPAELDGFKALIAHTPHILWLTLGGLITGTNPLHALIQGTARTITSENSGLKFHLLDFDPSDTLDLPAQTELVWRRWADLCASGDDDACCHEREFAVTRGGVVHVSRATGDPALNADFQRKQMHDGIAPTLAPYDPALPTIVDIEQPGLLDTFFFKPAGGEFSRALAAGEVDVDVCAVGLAMKDVLTALGTFDTPYFGLEYSGVVRGVGEGVRGVERGDRVVVMYKGSFDSRIRVREERVIRIREEDAFEEVASILVSYCTALHGIVELARARKGERILVHGGTSSLGMACIEVAKYLGLEIFATVSSESKASLLQAKYGIPKTHISSSKSASFSTDVLRATHGEGVDIIMSTLAGELVQESTLCLAHHGRFVDVGRSDVHEHGKLDLECFRRNIVFHSFDLDGVDLEVLWRLARDVIGLYQRGVIHAIKPIETFHITELSTAMRRFGQRSGPGGKIVVTFGEAPKPETLVRMQIPARHLTFDPNAAYLLVGCLGGLGRSLSRWMVSRGAKHLYFISRSGADRPAAALLAADLTASGAHATIIRGDITSYPSLTASLAQIPPHLPIKGVVQAAMVLKDSLFTNMSAPAFHLATAPKVTGTLNLHKALMDRQVNAPPLDFFVMTSSVSGYIGYLSQANYAAANTFLDALARHRRALGLPATSIALGVIEEVGYVSERGTVELLAAMHRMGLASSDEAEFLAQMEAAMMGPAPPQAQAQAGNQPGGDPFWDAYILTGLEPSKMLTLGVLDEKDTNITSAATTIPSMTESIVAALLTSDTRSSTLMHSIRVLNSTTSLTSLTSPPSSSSTTTHPSLTDLKHLASLPGPAGLDALVAAIRARLAVLLMLDVDVVEEGRTVMEYGLDSMVGAELRNWFFTVFRVQVPFLELLDPGLSIRGLGERVRGKMGVGR